MAWRINKEIAGKTQQNANKKASAPNGNGGLRGLTYSHSTVPTGLGVRS